ncbi:Outer membrane protein assembly factor BamB [Zhongshania aliphaticivorans]|uniref:Outer membrane protein assembly factor BamB n=1 Tax=Zhongshania aliphaticivorans TaxID=1470434 RepID=A0A5S9MRE2_9GAMM|nr:outer membrane protein assembly factor BamB [Zhongshania aliphaticivorans]CAA0078406.1 Outer membrane protein assembly factor BamB [Zhongshania aliphaticivorans]CAA0086687.1 Outer membrane protein assembly factor BamB [Zhongshania aliphaticivorans]
MKFVSVISMVLASALLVACASEPTSREPANLTSFDAEKKLKKEWSYSLGDGQAEAYHRIAPTVDGDEIFIASSDGKIAALNKSNGKKVWKKSYDLRISGGVGVSSTFLFVGTSDGEVVAIDRISGDIVWRVSLNSEVLSAPQSNGSVVVVQTYSGEVRGLNFADGEQLWSYSSQLPRLTMRGTSTPTVVSDIAMIGFANGHVIAFDIENGSQLWDQRISVPQGSTEIERLVDVDGRLRVMEDGQTVVATAYQGQVMAIDIRSGRPLWVKEASSYVGAADSLGKVYIVSADGSVNAIDDNGQGALWTQTVLARRELTEPVVFIDTIGVGDFEGYLHLLAREDGRLVARTRVDSDGLRAPMIADEKLLYVYGNSGKLVAYKLQDR